MKSTIIWRCIMLGVYQVERCFGRGLIVIIAIQLQGFLHA